MTIAVDLGRKATKPTKKAGLSLTLTTGFLLDLRKVLIAFLCILLNSK